MSQMNNFAEIVATKRKEKKMTQGELAKKLGISPQAISKWENGQGLPDVTLFPLLAETLDISLEELFGMEPSQRIEEKIFVKEEVVSSGVPQKMNELPLAGIGSRRACYSPKPVVEQKGEKIFFGDGSEADLDGGWSTNCGEGEIRIYKIEEIGHRVGIQYSDALAEKEWNDFPKSIDSLHFSIHASCKVRILKGDVDSCKLCVKSTEPFLEATSVEHDKSTLTVRVKNNVWNNWFQKNGDKNEITLWLPFEKGKKLRLSLYGACVAAVETDFEEGELKISGSGTFTVRSFEKRLEARISGSGSIKGQESLGATKLRISGSGDIRLGCANNADVKISGSGDVFAKASKGNGVVRISGSGEVGIKEIYGSLDVKISGSGDLSCGGDLDKLVFVSSGSGDLKGKNLTVKDAELHTMGAADIEIGRITGFSTEKFSKDTTIKIGRRG